MRAAAITALTGPDAVVVQEWAEPAPRSSQVLVDIEYAGVAFPDVLHTRGAYCAFRSLHRFRRGVTLADEIGQRVRRTREGLACIL